MDYDCMGYIEDKKIIVKGTLVDTIQEVAAGALAHTVFSSGFCYDEI